MLTRTLTLAGAVWLASALPAFAWGDKHHRVAVPVVLAPPTFVAPSMPVAPNAFVAQSTFITPSAAPVTLSLAPQVAAPVTLSLAPQHFPAPMSFQLYSGIDTQAGFFQAMLVREALKGWCQGFGGSGGSTADISLQLSQINSKLDTLLQRVPGQSGGSGTGTDAPFPSAGITPSAGAASGQPMTLSGAVESYSASVQPWLSLYNPQQPNPRVRSQLQQAQFDVGQAITRLQTLQTQLATVK